MLPGPASAGDSPNSVPPLLSQAFTSRPEFC
jgi:hypothetical protein